MRRERIEEIRNLDADDLAAYIVANDGHLAREIVEDWLYVTLPLWEMFYGNLTTKILEGNLAGPSPAQVYILKRMHNKGHRIAAIRGMLRWIGGSDRQIYRHSIRVMIEKGWLRIGSSAVVGLEYVLEPTRAGELVLLNYELDRKGRVYP